MRQRIGTGGETSTCEVDVEGPIMVTQITEGTVQQSDLSLQLCDIRPFDELDALDTSGWHAGGEVVRGFSFAERVA